MLDRLPDIILLDLARQMPQLALVNRKLFGISELLTRNRLLTDFGYSDEQLDELASDIHEHLRLESWAAVETVANKDYWIFGPEHVRPYRTDLFVAVYEPRPPKYYPIRGAPFGLQIGEWGSQCLEYTTRLRRGRYQMFLDVFIGRLPELSSTKFQIVNSPGVTQFFTSTPPYQWLERQSQFVSSLDLASTKLFVGTLDVSPEGKWADVTLRIESLDWDAPAGMVFNYLYFERHQTSHCALDWVVQPSLPTPTQALTAVYKRVNERKRATPAVSRPLAAVNGA